MTTGAMWSAKFAVGGGGGEGFGIRLVFTLSFFKKKREKENAKEICSVATRRYGR